MARIQGVTADSREERMEAERKRREIVSRAKKALRVREGLIVDDEEDAEDDEVMWTPSSSEDGSESPLGDGNSDVPGSRKRHRSDPDVDDKQIKKARRFANPSLQIQHPLDITTLAPVPLRITYPAHPPTDRPGTWFTSNFASLYRQIETFCSTYYSLHSIPITDEPWSKCKMTPEFIKWAEMVAEPEPRMGCWDELLRDSGMRKWFVMAIVVRVLRVKVFGVEIFGGTGEQRELMHQVDRAFLGREGEFLFPHCATLFTLFITRFACLSPRQSTGREAKWLRSDF